MAASAPAPVSARTCAATSPPDVGSRVCAAPRPSGRGAPPLHAVHRKNRRAAEHGQSRGQQADDALADHDHGLCDVQIGGEEGVQGDGADADEDARHRVQVGRQGMPGEAGGRHDGLAPMPPHAVDHVAHRHGSGCGAGGDTAATDLDDSADLAVPPTGQRVGDRRVLGDEQSPVRVPALVEVDVRSAIGGQLRSGRDAREQRPHPHGSGRAVLHRPLDDVDLSGTGEAHDARTGHATDTSTASATTPHVRGLQSGWWGSSTPWTSSPSRPAEPASTRRAGRPGARPGPTCSTSGRRGRSTPGSS